MIGTTPSWLTTVFEDEIPEGMEELVEKYRENLIEKAAEQDEEVLEAYLETGEAPDVPTLKKCIRKGTLDFSFVPVLCGTAFKNKGVQPLLDAVCDYLPSPLDLPPTKGKNPKNEEEDLIRETTPEEKLSGLAFKVPLLVWEPKGWLDNLRILGWPRVMRDFDRSQHLSLHKLKQQEAWPSCAGGC
eukprot:Skav221460  [mRNA]  locus=scaffold1700:284256:285599:+ [translate_table: standard]